MSLLGFTNGVHNEIRKAAAYGWQMTRMYMSPDDMKILLAGALNEASEAMDVTPETRIHGVPVKEHAKMPTGQVWFVFKGGKK